MSNKINIPRICFLLIITMLTGACGQFIHQPMLPRRATIGPESPAKKLLQDLPRPKEKIITAVYKFRDQTGQYKPSETGSNWSTAVTQGATTILIRALEESGWFVPIERENIGNLLNERKIIRTSRVQYEGDKNSESLLPPLLFAGVILEGGIISYETNILTGGGGVRYMGVDLSGQYREDRISIYIRAVSTSNGQILKTVYTTKSILSQEISTGLFRYITPKRILETETGFTYNEPTEMCVTEAIEKAVESLIIEGVRDNLWATQHPQDTTSTAFTNYWKEKQWNYEVGSLKHKKEDRIRGLLCMGFQAGSNSYSGDYAKSEQKPKASLSLGIALNRYLYIEPEFGIRELIIKNKIDDKAYFSDLSMRLLLRPFNKLSPYVSIGGGIDFNLKSQNVGLTQEKYIPQLSGLIGLEYMVSRKLGISLSSGINYYLNDKFDGIRVGRYNDFAWGVSMGMKLYLFNLK